MQPGSGQSTWARRTCTKRNSSCDFVSTYDWKHSSHMKCTPVVQVNPLDSGMLSKHTTQAAIASTFGGFKCSRSAACLGSAVELDAFSKPSREVGIDLGFFWKSMPSAVASDMRRWLLRDSEDGLLTRTSFSLKKPSSPVSNASSMSSATAAGDRREGILPETCALRPLLISGRLLTLD